MFSRMVAQQLGRTLEQLDFDAHVLPLFGANFV